MTWFCTQESLDGRQSRSVVDAWRQALRVCEEQAGRSVQVIFEFVGYRSINTIASDWCGDRRLCITKRIGISLSALKSTHFYYALRRAVMPSRENWTRGAMPRSITSLSLTSLGYAIRLWMTLRHWQSAHNKKGCERCHSCNSCLLLLPLGHFSCPGGQEASGVP